MSGGMDRGESATFFAEPARASTAELESAVKAATSSPVVDAILRGLGSLAVIVNRQRQIVAVNESLLHHLGLHGAGSLLGLRPGEVLGCVHSGDPPVGCGTTRFCETCGAAVAMVMADRDQLSVERECALFASRGGEMVTIALRVRAFPLQLERSRMTVVLLDDISDAKRSAALERSFFHDLNNVIFALSSVTEELSESQHATGAARDARHLLRRLAREIELHQILSRPETPRLHTLDLETVPVEPLLWSLGKIGKCHPGASGRKVTVETGDPSVQVATDPVLLTRVLCEMVINGIEATPAEGEVRVWSEVSPASISFKVWSRAAIPSSVAPRIFQRYFSTKPGLARGQGTFVARLLGETYLGGRVGFVSDAAAGTTFFIELPRFQEAA
jgi:signal transduction histidine kinase